MKRLKLTEMGQTREQSLRGFASLVQCRRIVADFTPLSLPGPCADAVPRILRSPMEISYAYFSSASVQ